MAYKSSEVAILSRPKKNTTGATIKRGSAVKLSAAVYDEIALCNADADVLYGVARDNILDQDIGEIGVIGTYKCRAGAAVTRGWRVGPDANGKFVRVTVDHKTVAGVAEESAAAAEDLFEVTLGVGITLSV